mmetsp:Transcript_24436/g.44190  ORF Transcript_24436/g.44190 Transcript_24436/m.44190 type:complete len:535 (-) Transcript_24436:95-1699(-)|eukprot:CAMPEP_0198295660 /NCGR_PEP_ID=MMETSP1449-20131203/28980_1 /TAXON_ID=420275 /ORGANISM="Attheya septentrionalis, Strain CCMP2084" /LENGTH=534 /DNA_ID=CAMNT_0043996041 /DNA_START=128 /DNA_END=1732 /DNA_ORIENTATION=-
MTTALSLDDNAAEPKSILRKRERRVIEEDDDEPQLSECQTEEEDLMEEDKHEEKKIVSPEPALKPAQSSVNSADAFSPELLRMYYSRLFPYHFLYSWLSYDASSLVPSGGGGSSSKMSSSNSIFSRREFSMTSLIGGDEIYIRYQSFKSEAELQSAIMAKSPIKIDIGAVYNNAPKDKKALAPNAFKPEQRELVFDIDLTDYDEVRNCGCSGASICTKCWTSMSMAIKVMDKGLRNDFGFKHMSWFYSGRRGVHCWVCDESARELPDAGRSAVASYFEVMLGNDKNNNVVLSHPLHPMLSRAYSMLEPLFIKHVLPESGHGLLATEESCMKMLKMLPPGTDSVVNALLKEWKGQKSSKTTPAEKWHSLTKKLNELTRKSPSKGKSANTMDSKKRISIEQFPIATVFRYTYPRLDINVSKCQNHLLKSPFCVHPKTGRVCVPIDISQVDTFDPFAVPTLAQLMQELDEYEAKQKASEETEGGSTETRKVQHDWQKTSLKVPFEHFQKTFLTPMLKELRREQRAEQEERAAVMGDF